MTAHLEKFGQVNVSSSGNVAPNINTIKLVSTNCPTCDHRLFVTASDTDNNLDNAYVGATSCNIFAQSCEINISDTTLSGTTWVNDTYNAKVSNTFNFSITDPGIKQNTTTKNESYHIYYYNSTISNNDGSNEINYTVNFSTPTGATGNLSTYSFSGNLSASASALLIVNYYGDWLTESSLDTETYMQNSSRITESNHTHQYILNQTNITLTASANLPNTTSITLVMCPNNSTITGITAGSDTSVHNCSYVSDTVDWISFMNSTPTQNTTLNVLANTVYNVIFRTLFTFSSTKSTILSINHSYFIDSDFPSPKTVRVLNSTFSNRTVPVNATNTTWLTQNIDNSSNLLEYAEWTCINCVNNSETLNEYSTNRYSKNVSLTSLLSLHTINVNLLTIDVPDIYSTDTFDLNIYKNGSAYTTGVTTILSGNYYSYVTVSNFNLSTANFQVLITPKPAGAGTTTPGGGGGGAPGEVVCAGENETCVSDANCCGGLKCENEKCVKIEMIEAITANFTFDIYPKKFEPAEKNISRGSTINFTIIVYNMERDPTKSMYTNYTWSWTMAEYSLADWCVVRAETFTVNPSSVGKFMVSCMVPDTAIYNRTYSATLLVWPDGMKHLAKPAYFQITPGVQEFDPIQAIKQASLNFVDAMAYPLLCISRDCINNNLGYWELMERSFFFINGFQLWMVIAIVIFVLYWFKIR